MNRIALYARVSTREQHVEPQLDALRAYAKARGLEVVREYVDRGVSGAKDRRPALDEMVRDARRRRFDAVAAVMARPSLPRLGPYAASKFALEGIAESMRRELAPSGIDVALIEPGAVATPMMQTKAKQEGEAFLAALEGEAREIYGEFGAAVLAAFGRFADRASPAERVAEAIEHALTAAKPRIRYLVGVDARAQALMVRFLPDRLRDAAIARLLQLPR